MKRVVGSVSASEALAAPAALPAPAALADPSFADDLIAWQKIHGRHTLPWQNTTDAYRIWLSEIMLQQTQVAAVVPYYLKFLLRFPDVGTLAVAPTEEVMAHWSGLGYYSRARNLHRCAQQVVARYGGVFPADPALLAELPGIGRSTAAAISAFAYGTRAAILDGNVKRVFARVFGIDSYPGERQTEEQLWQRAVALLPPTGVEAYTQGLMDLGATLCTRARPRCERCPLAGRCVALATGRVAELPVRKPKKAIPQKYVAMLVVIDAGQVLLMQRPDSGIWGGLLSLPELDGFSLTAPEAAATTASTTSTTSTTSTNRATGDAARLLLAAVGDVGSCAALLAFTHGFTHFKLQVTPYRITLSRRTPGVAQAGMVWLDAARIGDAALPAPVKKLLLALLGPDDLFASAH